MQKILTKIKNNLKKIETILSTEIIIALLEEKNINTTSFLHTIQEYQERFEVLKSVEDITLLEELDENLAYFIAHSQNKTQITLYYAELAISITFIQNNMKNFFNISDKKAKNIEEKENINLALQSIEINHFYSINTLKIDNLSDKNEIYIVGENGDGKTLLLQAIAIALKGVEEGDVFNLAKSQNEFHANIVLEDNNIFNKETQEYKNLFAYGSHRANSCKMEVDRSGYGTLFSSSVDLLNPIEWLRDIYNETNDNQKVEISLEKAISIIKKLLNKDIEISVNAKSVTFKERGHIVSFEQLSAGYRSVIILICDLLDRLSKNQSHIEDISQFRGVVLIDEIELHLHPKWKYRFIHTLREILPNIQFIVTTHSPTVLLGASKEAVFYKIYKDDTGVQISNQIANEGYTQNSLVSSPLFDLENITSRFFEKDVSSSDYVYSKIHQVISKRVKEDLDIDEDELMALIDKELDNL